MTNGGAAKEEKTDAAQDAENRRRYCPTQHFTHFIYPNSEESKSSKNNERSVVMSAPIVLPDKGATISMLLAKSKWKSKWRFRRGTKCSQGKGEGGKVLRGLVFALPSLPPPSPKRPSFLPRYKHEAAREKAEEERGRKIKRYAEGAETGILRAAMPRLTRSRVFFLGLPPVTFSFAFVRFLVVAKSSDGE